MITTAELLSSPLPHLEAGLQTDVARCPANTLLRGTACPACRGEFRPLARELLLCFLFISDAALPGLIDSEAGGGGHVQLATPSNVEFRHTISNRHDQLRA